LPGSHLPKNQLVRKSPGRSPVHADETALSSGDWLGQSDRSVCWQANADACDYFTAKNARIKHQGFFPEERVADRECAYPWQGVGQHWEFGSKIACIPSLVDSIADSRAEQISGNVSAMTTAK
jgi:hypothetical protein